MLVGGLWQDLASQKREDARRERPTNRRRPLRPEWMNCASKGSTCALFRCSWKSPQARS